MTEPLLTLVTKATSAMTSPAAALFYLLLGGTFTFVPTVTLHHLELEALVPFRPYAAVLMMVGAIGVMWRIAKLAAAPIQRWQAAKAKERVLATRRRQLIESLQGEALRFVLMVQKLQATYLGAERPYQAGSYTIVKTDPYAVLGQLTDECLEYLMEVQIVVRAQAVGPGTLELQLARWVIEADACAAAIRDAS